MAKKVVPVVDSAKSDLIATLSDFSHLKNLDRATLMSVLEDVFRAMIRKKYGDDGNFDIIVNVDKGDLQAFRERVIVEDLDLEDESKELTLSEALGIDEDYEVGETVVEVIHFSEFARRQVLAAKQLLAQRIKELEKQLFYDQYIAQKGDIVVGEVYQVWKNEILVMHDNNELILPKSEQIPKDRFKKGDTIRAVVLDVELRNGNPKVLLSRSAPVFLERLFEREVPEISDGTITIKKIVREPGERAKVAVESFDERIDPVGACVGMRGARIFGISKELKNENIDVINYSANPVVFISRALSPARPLNIEINDQTHEAQVLVRGDQVALAIGKGGMNVQLASRLTGYELTIYKEEIQDNEDVDLDEFEDEIPRWIIDSLKAIGCDTAKSVLHLSVDELERRTSLERSALEGVLEILQKEFEA
jgi:N utilization substance protein A